MRLAQIVEHFVHRPGLRPGQAKRQPFEKESEQRPIHLQHRRLPRAAPAIREAHGKLLREELVELHAAPGRVGLGAGLRTMQEAHGAGEVREAEAAAQAFGEGVVERLAVQRLEDERAQVGLLQARGGRVDRRQRIRERLARGHDAVAGMRHFRAEKARAHFAERAHPQALLGGALELLELAAVEVEKAQHQALGMHYELPLRSIHDLCFQNLGLDAHRLPCRRRVGRRKEGLVLVAQRQVEHEVEARAQPELLQFLFQSPFNRRAGSRRSRRSRRAADRPRRPRRAPGRARARTEP